MNHHTITVTFVPQSLPKKKKKKQIITEEKKAANIRRRDNSIRKLVSFLLLHFFKVACDSQKHKHPNIGPVDLA